MPNILYITYDGLTDPLGQSQVLPYIVNLSKQGFKFTILSFEKKERMHREGAVVRALTAKAGIEWVPMRFSAHPPIVSKIWDRWRMRSQAFSLHRTRNFQMVHCRSYVAAEVGLALKQKAGLPFVFDMRGFWADEKVDNGQWNQQQFFFKQLYRFYKQKEKLLLLGASHVITLTHAAAQYLHAQAAYNRLPISVIPCCADLDHFNYNKLDEDKMLHMRQMLGLRPEHKVLVYLGSIGGWYMTKEMFRFFFLLYKKRPEYRLLVLTKDAPELVIAEAVAVGCIPETIMVRYALREELPSYLAVCSSSIFFIRNSFSKLASSPTKHAELMGMGLPVICNSIGDTGAIVAETGTGMLIESFDDNAMETVIESIDCLTKIERYTIRTAALKYFDLNGGVASYHQVYKQLLN